MDVINAGRGIPRSFGGRPPHCEGLPVPRMTRVCDCGSQPILECEPKELCPLLQHDLIAFLQPVQNLGLGAI